MITIKPETQPPISKINVLDYVNSWFDVFIRNVFHKIGLLCLYSLRAFSHVVVYQFNVNSLNLHSSNKLTVICMYVSKKCIQ